jgi:hypothetical protein
MPAEVELWAGLSMGSEERLEEGLLDTCLTSCKLEHVMWNEFHRKIHVSSGRGLSNIPRSELQYI